MLNFYYNLIVYILIKYKLNFHITKYKIYYINYKIQINKLINNIIFIKD